MVGYEDGKISRGKVRNVAVYSENQLFLKYVPRTLGLQSDLREMVPTS